MADVKLSALDEIAIGASTDFIYTTRAGVDKKMQLGGLDTIISENADVTANTAKTGITAQQTTDITTNSAKVGVTNEEQNTINSIVAGEPAGSDVILNKVSLTQAEYDAGTPIATTEYSITDA